MPAGGADIRAAVAIDCEMGTNESGESELIRVTVVDYFTSEVLVDNLVEPDVGMRHLNTQFSGVTWADMKRARNEGTLLKGKPSARAAVWWFVGTDTVVVGHGVSNDLRSLRWIHALVVDSFTIEFGFAKKKEEAELAAAAEKAKAAERAGHVAEFFDQGSLVGEYVPTEPPLANTSRVVPNDKGKETTERTQKKKKGSGNLSLKTLTQKRLGRQIQAGGKAGHDSLEDAIAARDLVHWIIMNPNFER